ncbi:hypothetical protein [Rhizobium laguerreae]|uniref:hypothetical protein n=1 Tax=Rhizobium laguerreae TaxID=1076926 RepID=UPI001C912283|nr:hypothetical protein [Rhizobium laguerreae]MBY3383071.1 hypothetical protein [Rhizobium laguerreae]
MRFSEKSFEVRFCAALSAAAIPFNRNPQWIGMTQAQERINGIDTMLRLGGQLYVFQFKAKQNDSFKLDRFQWRCLSGIGKRYSNSTYYIFPEASDVKAAASVKCILNHSWCVPAANIGPAFRHGADTGTLSLIPSGKALVRKRPKSTIGAKTACAEFGCFCPSPGTAIIYTRQPNDGALIYFSAGGADGVRSPESRLPVDLMGAGIPLGEAPRAVSGERPIQSANEFEQMLEDGAEKDLAPGLFGLFLPSK